MGCLASKPNPEVQLLISQYESLSGEKAELLLTLNNTKISKHLNSKPLDLKLRNDSKITKEFLETNQTSIESSLEQLKTLPNVEEADFVEIFDQLEDLMEHEFYTNLKLSLKSTQSVINSLEQKAKELGYIHEDLQRDNFTLEDLEIRRTDTEKEIKQLKAQQVELNNKIAETKEYMENLKRRKRRFTVTALPPSKVQLRSKAVLKSELEKKIELIKTEQARFLQRLEEKREGRDQRESPDMTLIKSAARKVISFKEQPMPETIEFERKITANRRMTLNKGSKPF